MTILTSPPSPFPLFFVCGTEDQTQSLVLGRQELYHWLSLNTMSENQNSVLKSMSSSSRSQSCYRNPLHTVLPYSLTLRSHNQSGSNAVSIYKTTAMLESWKTSSSSKMKLPNGSPAGWLCTCLLWMLYLNSSFSKLFSRLLRLPPWPFLPRWSYYKYHITIFQYLLGKQLE